MSKLLKASKSYIDNRRLISTLMAAFLRRRSLSKRLRPAVNRPSSKSEAPLVVSGEGKFMNSSLSNSGSYLIVLAIAVAILTLNSGNVLAQTGGTGIVVGTVTDPSGAGVPGATVTLTDATTNSERTTTTNEGGRYDFPNVPPGKYNLTISKAGFRVGKFV